MQTKDATCTVRDIEVTAHHVVDVAGFVRVLDHVVDVAGFVRVLDFYEDDSVFYPSRLHLLVLCDADPIVWRLRFEVVTPGDTRECLTGLTYIGRWGSDAVFMRPPTRAGDAPWSPQGGEAASALRSRADK